MRKIPLPLLIFSLFIISIGIVGVAIMTELIPLRDILTSFYTFVWGLVIISILAIIGAIFMGMFLSHRVFSSRQFTTFEEEMLKMKDDVEYIKKSIEELKKEDSD